MANYRTASSSKTAVTRALRVTALMALTAGAGIGVDLEPRQPGHAGVHAVKLSLKKHKKFILGGVETIAAVALFGYFDYLDKKADVSNSDEKKFWTGKDYVLDDADLKERIAARKDLDGRLEKTESVPPKPIDAYNYCVSDIDIRLAHLRSEETHKYQAKWEKQKTLAEAEAYFIQKFGDNWEKIRGVLNNKIVSDEVKRHTCYVEWLELFNERAGIGYLRRKAESADRFRSEETRIEKQAEILPEANRIVVEQDKRLKDLQLAYSPVVDDADAE